MGWYKCNGCGHTFEDGEFAKKEEYRGVCHGTPAYENVYCCECCGSDDICDAEVCSKCGTVVAEDDFFDGLCEECSRDIYMEYKYDIKKCYELSLREKQEESVNIDFFLSCMFTKEEINSILYRELVCASSVRPVDCTQFIETDRSWFNEKALKGVS
jgi:hypothetical protein